MPFPFIIAAAAGIGALAGYGSQQERLKDAQSNDEILRLKRMGQWKSIDASREILKGHLTMASLGATDTSRKSAVGAYQAKSAGEAAIGSSGLSGGSPYYNLANEVAQNRNALLALGTSSRAQMGNMQAQGAADIYNQNIGIQITTKQIDQMQEELGYLSSPMAFMLATATGAMSGAKLGADITSVGTAISGNTKWGTVDLGSRPSGPEYSGGTEVAPPSGIDYLTGEFAPEYSVDWKSFWKKISSHPAVVAPRGLTGQAFVAPQQG